MPILYSFKRCPYAMRARMAILLGNISCEIREIRLKNKPEHMLEISPKGTVPILLLNDRVIDESMDIINWVVAQKSIFASTNEEQNKLTEHFITIFDDNFKYHLDRYKYSTRYHDADLEYHRDECLKILIDLENSISNNKWIFGDEINKLDISILPFIRQYKIANPIWFDAQQKIIKIKKLLDSFVESKLSQKAMHRYDVWEPDTKPVFFPAE